jgi:signal transduction histidine kinase
MDPGSRDEPDVLTADDRAALRELAEGMWEARRAVAGEWTRRLLQAQPGAFPEGRLIPDQLTLLNETFLTVILEKIRADDFSGLYHEYYERTRQLIEADLQRAPANRISLASLYFSARVSLGVIYEHVGSGALPQLLAYTKLTIQLMMLVGRAYSDSRETYLQRTFEQINTLSHELRTPITHVFSYLEMLRAGDFGAVTPRQESVLAELMHEADDLLLLLTGTLELSRLDTGRVQMHPEEFDMGSLLADVVSGTPHGDVRVRWTVSADLPLLHTDRIKLKQVLANLLRNAVRYGGGSAVFITAAMPRAGHVEVGVLDHGPGIKPEDLQVIFKFLERGDAAGLARDGYGIGLHVVRRLLRLLGGRIEVDSVLGEGTCFRFTMPLRLPPRSLAAMPGSHWSLRKE